MARLPRLTPAGIPQHLIQRGNNRQVCFCCEDDFVAYAGWLREYSQQHRVKIHAWVFMTNHVHLLATPETDDGIARMMQSLGRMYVRYFNRTYRRTGTLWEGRYRSCLVQSETYLLECYRYIELNPVRAGMVHHPSDYFWSSYSANALGKSSSILTAHPEYLKLGRYPKQRRARYRALFDAHLERPTVDEITAATNKGLALGSSSFKEQVEQMFNRRVTEGKVGRPRLAGG
ncbi:transposase [uncultured Microbulbifer sp.]|uniref:transposase n=1 Tax=uncultured Microbulbifer sp. TaxID=348147 RepID=UPI0025D8043C|nr:transposase [uncultured Microbulbifer sp.]